MGKLLHAYIAEEIWTVLWGALLTVPISTLSLSAANIKKMATAFILQHNMGQLNPQMGSNIQHQMFLNILYNSFLFLFLIQEKNI